MAGGPRPVSEGPFPLQCMVIERVGRRVLLMGGYCLMTCWGSIFTVALCLQVADGEEEEGGGCGLSPTSPQPSAAELLPLDALRGHVLHLCLHPQLWHRPR